MMMLYLHDVVTVLVAVAALTVTESDERLQMLTDLSSLIEIDAIDYVRLKVSLPELHLFLIVLHIERCISVY